MAKKESAEKAVREVGILSSRTQRWDQAPHWCLFVLTAAARA